jgi:hypothetical protein
MEKEKKVDKHTTSPPQKKCESEQIGKVMSLPHSFYCEKCWNGKDV